MPAALNPLPLLRFLHERRVEHVVIGGVAVSAHGYVRPSKDLDIVPNPSTENLVRLAAALAELNAKNAVGGDFEDGEFPFDPTSVEDLGQGGNFRLVTDLGELDVMQWVAGIDAHDLYSELAAQAIEGTPSNVPMRVCGLAHLRAMKQAAGRPAISTISNTCRRQTATKALSSLVCDAGRAPYLH